MSLWSGIAKVAKGANKVRKGVGKAKGVANQVKEDGVGKTAAKLLSAKIRKKFLQMILHAVKGLIGFLLTPPFGWLCDVMIVFLLAIIGHTGFGVTSIDSNNTNNTSGDNVTQQQYVALSKSCNSGGDGSYSSPIDGNASVKNGKYKWTYDQVARFLTSSVKATWGVDTHKAEAMFLARGVTSTAYGLDKSNIGKITKTVQDAGVSPIFFYFYSMEEGGGAGGYINHYSKGAKELNGDAVHDAKADADYIKSHSQMTGFKAATEDDVPGVPTEPAQKLIDSSPKGSIGKVYLPATAAATGDIAELKTSYKLPSKFGPPIRNMMDRIKNAGGDPMKDTQMADSDDSSNNCDGSKTTTVSGGMSYDQAQSFMKKFYDTDITAKDFPGAAPGKPNIHNNCTVFVSWFINKFTKLKTGGGNGGEIVDKLKAVNSGLKTTDTPEPYTVFSIQGNHGSDLTAGDAGHTGIVLGIDKAKGKAILGEAMYGLSFTKITDVNSGVNTVEYPLSKMNSKQGWSFINLNDHMKSKNISF